MAEPRPEDFVDFATNDNYATGPQVGQPTKVPMDANYIADGNKRGLDNAPDAQEFNWWMNGVGRWIRYLVGFFTEDPGDAGDVLTSDGAGGAIWQPASAGGAGLATTAPVNVTRAPAATGTATTAARADHKHDAEIANVVTIGTVNTAGTGSALALATHVHAHGNQPGGSLHALATQTVAGFMSPADKQKLDGVASGAGASGFLNVLDAGVTGGPLADNTARAANLTAFNAAVQTAADTNRILLIPPLDYEIYGDDGVIFDRGFTLVFATPGSMITQFKNDAPSVHVGPPLGTPGQTIEGFVLLGGLYVRRNAPAVEGGNGIEFTGAYSCRFDNVQSGDVNMPLDSATSVHWDGVHFDSLAGTVPCFSNQFGTIRVKHFLHDGVHWYRQGYEAWTGNEVENLYISSGTGGGARDITATGGVPLRIGSCAQCHIGQLNIEWSICETAIAGELINEFVVDSCNIEGVALKGTGPINGGLISVYIGNITIDGLTVADCPMLAANNLSKGSIFKLASGSSVAYRAVRTRGNVDIDVPFSVVMNWSGGGDQNCAVSAGHLNLLSDDPGLTRFDDFTFSAGNDGALWSALEDFNNDTLTTITPSPSITLYTYMTPGIYNVATPGGGGSVVLYHTCASDLSIVIPRGVVRELRNTGTGTLSVINRDSGGVIATIAAGGAGRFVFDKTDWKDVTLNAGGGGGGGVALATTSPVSVSRSSNLVGDATTAARANHKHDVLVGTPVAIGSANAMGTLATLALSDHVHAHGNQSGGTLHAAATAVLAGFMASIDKQRLDAIYSTFHIARDQPLIGVEAEFESTKIWQHVGFNYPRQMSTIVNFPYRIYLNVPMLAAKIESITLTLQGASGHAALPASKPGFVLYRGLTALGAVSDPATTVSQYQADHSMTLTGPFTLTATDPWYVAVAGEAGANAVSGLQIKHLSVWWGTAL